jgi:hypothetical protein
MTPSELEAWLAARSPDVPKPLLPHLLGVAEREVSTSGAGTVPGEGEKSSAGEGSSEEPDGGGTPTQQLAELAYSALAEALGSPGRDRVTAFRLLAGDAFLTYACEASLEGENPGGTLETLLARTGKRLL